MSRAFKVTTTDSYQELLCPRTSRVTLQLPDGPVYIGFGHGGPPAYGTDELFLPVTASVGRRCDAIRVKSGISGVPATAIVTTLDQHD